jgi:DNA-binding response OmpR family regulator
MRRRVLTVEVTPDIALVLRMILEAAGHVVQWAGDRLTARALLAGPRPPHLVILEPTGLPDGDGLDLCREIKAASPSRPVVVLTSWVAAKSREEALAAGADAFLTKPFDHDELLTTVRRLLAGAPAGSPGGAA